MKRDALGTAIGTVELVDGKKRVKLRSPEHWQAIVSRLTVGGEYALTIEGLRKSRSQQQLRYYWALLGYLADYSGHEVTELHDAIMRQKFGVKQVVVGSVKETVRRSIADVARFPKEDMVELIDEVLRICQDCGVRVPSKEELGYLRS